MLHTWRGMGKAENRNGASELTRLVVRKEKGIRLYDVG